MSSNLNAETVSDTVDREWVESFAAIAEIVLECISEDDGDSISDDVLALKIVKGIKEKLGGKRLYLPEKLSHMREVYEAAQNNGIPHRSESIKKHFHSLTKLKADAVYGSARRIAALKDDIFGRHVTSLDIENACTAMGVIERIFAK